MVVFDKATNSNILYSNPKHDVSDKVLKKMGLKPGETNDGVEGEEEDSGEEKSGSAKDKSGAGTKPTGNKPGTTNSKRNP
jgi:hypothetical protein